ncbi:SusD/RagB family nutrient-binding outer membrane lipoprotein [Flavihumibacter fluvii]|uniref:SusD/RagB family nutrient-binding outer membrane lipoprotein n=1 Tax=Flavihumibacter fluvii TaxID=2838157 RepID=UPI001BDF0743|nr:SusD/RagB family nutrient-binding outer membrane lipoprotein [Flavihumibacter fluvii]ULQ51422.1 SusD/RagB family nutrient-binding outer membrane lipoprotein [Flavihumibacter fluvii]
MKKNNTGFNFLMVLSTLVLFSSCTKDFEEINTDKTKIEVLAPKQLDKLFSTAEYAGITNTDQWAGGYQLIVSLATDQQAQFFSCTQINFPSDRNAQVGRWIQGGWGAFLQGATTLAEILKQTGPESPIPDPLREAVAKIWKVYIFMPMTDDFGPIPYSQVGSGEDVILYDSQESIYMDFFKILTEATAVLSQNTGKKAFATGDVIYEGDLDKWLKLGNSLRLRAAMRVSKVVPDIAKTQAEAAVAAPGGLMTDNADNAFMHPTPPNYLNPLGVISEWGEFRMSAAMESTLKGYQDPRIGAYFSPAEATGLYKGIRNGLSIVQMAVTENTNPYNSNVPPRFRNAANVSEPHALMVAAETWFNLAEAAVNGWNTGGLSAKVCYENGIKASMAQWAVTIPAGYLESTKTPQALGDIYNTPAMSDIPVAFGATPEVQREQIATQKWLALYPSMSPEAWAEFRRTGYPRLFPRLNNENPDASTDQASMKRLIFPPDEQTINKGGYESGLQLLGGPDKTSTLLWWDK